MSQTKSVVFNDGYKFDLELRNSFFQKFRGLLGVQYLEEKQGIVLAGCKQIHTFGMKFPIDIVVLSREGVVIDFVGDLKANKISRYYKDSYYIIELMVNHLNEKLFKKDQIIKFN
jgi:uncharacterized membrane protein (UPF0127 family)